MTLEEADKGLYEAIKFVGSKKRDDKFPFKVDKILILPNDETSPALTIDIIRRINSSSNSIAKVLKDEGLSEKDFDYFVYSTNGTTNSMHIMKLNDYIPLT